VRAEVITATPLADDTRGEVQHRLQVALSKEVTLIETVDPAVIGGMVIRIGDTVYDNSVAGKISNISRKAKDGFASYLMNHADSMIGESAS
ncbi:MAG: F0F1 ATP synthase subunit delta, partial [Planctomycetota bacterium]